MLIKRLSHISVPIAVALATLLFLLMVLSTQAGGPVIDTQSPNAAISTVFGQTPYAKTGHAIATGDVNGDGYQDLIVGAPYADLMPAGVSTVCISQSFNEYVDCVGGGAYLYLGRPEISHTLDLASEPANVVFYASPDQFSGDELGRSVTMGDLNGDGLDDIVVGSSDNDSASPGAAFVWVGRRSITTTTAISVNIKERATATTDGYNLEFAGACILNHLGWDVATGDVNGDGIDDLIAGAPRASVDTVTDTNNFPPDYQCYHYSAADRTRSGAVYVRLGSTGLISSAGSQEDPMRCLPELTIYGQNSDDYLGRSLASGDVDGDGYADIVVGADGANPGGSLSNAGKVYVFYGSNAITYTRCSIYYPPYVFENQIVKELAYVTTTADITITGAAAGNHSGYDVSTGDLNGDGYDDIIVGAPYANSNRGRVYVVFGGPRASISPTIPLNQADLAVSGATTDAWLGASVFARDLNHDGTDDLIMGAIGIDPDDADSEHDPASARKGAAYVLFGGSSLSGTVDLGSGSPADLTVLGASSDDWLGRGLAAGDLNGDSFNELLVGAPGLDHTDALTRTGAAYLINLTYPQSITVTGNLTQVTAGNSVTFHATATTWLDTRDVTTRTSFSISPAAGGAWLANSYTSSRAGSWTVTGTLDSLAGTTSLTVLPGPLTTISISPSTVFVSPNDLAQFQASGQDKGDNPIPDLTFTWSIVNGGGQIVASGPSTLTVRAAVTDATYFNTVVAAASGKSAAASIVVLNAAPQALFTCGSCSISEGSPLSFDASSSSDPNHDPLTFAWTFGDGSSGSGPTPSHPYPDNGTYTVTLTVTDDNGLTDTDQHPVTVSNVPPAPTITAPTTASRNQSVTFSANPNDPGRDTFTFRWDWGDETAVVTTTTASVIHTFTAPSTYTVTLLVTDDDGGSGQTSHVILIQPTHYIYLPLTIRGL